jgi:hypothetical protein
MCPLVARPIIHLAGFKGVLHVDGYGGYRAGFGADRPDNRPVLVVAADAYDGGAVGQRQTMFDTT